LPWATFRAFMGHWTQVTMRNNKTKHFYWQIGSRTDGL